MLDLKTFARGTIDKVKPGNLNLPIGSTRTGTYAGSFQSIKSTICPFLPAARR